ncbi:MAG: NYN domain-containing protein [Patescibacteria group bacterium]
MPDRVTIKPNPHHRVGVFVDMQNLYHSAKHLHSARINFAELVKLASSERQVVRALVYVVKSGEGEEEKAFFDALEKSGLELKMKDLQVFAGGAKKADWDVGMAVDAISMAKQLDVVVLVTGDGDFVPLVEYLQHNGIIVEAVSFGRSTSLRLKEAVNNFTDLDEHRKVLMRIPGGAAPRTVRTPRVPRQKPPTK